MPTAPRSFKPHGTTERKPWQRSGPDLRAGFRGEKRMKAKHRILERDDFTCQHCGMFVEAEDSHLDHILALTRGGTHDDDNLQTLCIKCSNRKTYQESQGMGTLHIISGAPGSGKTTYVQERMRPGDMVFDFDAIAKAMGADEYDHPSHFVQPIESVRQAVLNQASLNQHATWVIYSAHRKAVEAAKRYGGVLTVLDTPAEECIRRLSGRPKLQGRIERVHEWWTEYKNNTKNA